MRILATSLLLATLLAALPAAEPGRPAVAFEDVTEKAGLKAPLAGLMGHGGAWGDFDGDGRLDLYVGGFCDRPDKEYAPAAGPVPNRLLRNRGDGKFEEVLQPAVTYHGRTSGAVFADLDNNATPELYVANNARAKTRLAQEPQKTAQTKRSTLFRNDAGKMVDISEASGACPPDLLSARNIGVFDYDGDGRLDLYVVEDRFTARPRSALFRNEGGLKFRDVTKEAGLPEDVFGLGLAVADLNADGRPDFFVGHSNRLFLSQMNGGKTTYREAVELRDVLQWPAQSREDWPCGAAFGDLNRDGRLDLVVTIHATQARNKVFLNAGVKDGIPRFRDVTAEAGLGDVVPVRCPHVEIQDFDNDGWPDIYTSAAWRDEQGRVTPLVYRHQGVGKDGVPRFLPPRPIGGPMVYYPAGPSADYDRDGRLDLFLINWFQENHSRLLRNDSPKRRWLDVQVVGKTMNRAGIGAQVKVYPAGQAARPAALLGYQEVTTGYGYASGQPAVCHFGLGAVAEVDVEVTFPGGRFRHLTRVPADQQVTVIEE